MYIFVYIHQHISSYLRDGRPVHHLPPLQPRRIGTNPTPQTSIATEISKVRPTIVATNYLPARPVIRVLSNSLPRQLLRRRHPKSDRAPPQNTLPALMPLNAAKCQMFPYHREDIHGTKPSQRAIKMGRPLRTKRFCRMEEARTTLPQITIVTSSAPALIVLTYDHQLQSEERQSGVARRDEPRGILRR